MRKISTVLAIGLLVGSLFPAAALGQQGDKPAAEAQKESTEKTDSKKQEEGKYQQLVDRARSKYQDEDYVGAVALLKQAHELEGDPGDLYKIGRIYETMGKFSVAIDYYERFAKAPGIDQSARQEALSRIKTLREVAELDKEDEPAVQPPAEPTMEASYTPGWALTGVGLAVIGGAVAATLVAGGKDHDAKDSNDPDEQHHLEDEAATWSTISYIGYGLGGLVSVGGVYFFLSPPMYEVQSPSMRTGQTHALTPVVGYRLQF